MEQYLFEYEKQLNIVDVLQRRGYELLPKGREYCLKEHDSIVISAHGWYMHKEGRGGYDAASFLQAYEGYSYKAAVQEIVTMMRGELTADVKQQIKNDAARTSSDVRYVREKTISKKPILFLPTRCADMRQTFAYLIKTRCLDKDILSELVHEKKLYQSREWFLGKSDMNDKPIKIISLEQLKDLRNARANQVARITKYHHNDFYFYKAYDTRGNLSYLGVDKLVDGSGQETDIEALQAHGLPILEKRNCVFVGYNDANEPCYANMRGTNSNQPFKHDVIGSDKKYSFRMNENLQTDTVYVFEAPIDAISYAGLMKMGGGDWHSLAYVCLDGLSDNALDTYLQLHPDVKNIKLCIDNDEAADIAANGKINQRGEYHPGLIQKYQDKGYVVERLYPSNKDWNEDLVNIVRSIQREEQAADDMEDEGEMEM